MAYLVLLRDSSKTQFICTCDVAEVYRASKEGWTVLRKLDLNRAHELGIVDVEELVEQVYREWGEPGDRMLPKRGKDYELINYFRRLKDWRDENCPEAEPTKSIAELVERNPKIQRKRLDWWYPLRWGTFALSLCALFLGQNGRYLVLTSVLIALWANVSGVKRLIFSLEEFGIQNPFQTLVLTAAGVAYWMTSTFGLWLVLNHLGGEFHPLSKIPVLLFGALGTFHGAVCTFNWECNELGR